MDEDRRNGPAIIDKLYGDAGKQRIDNLSSISDKLAQQLVKSIGAAYGSAIIPTKMRSAITMAVHIIEGDLVGMKVHYNIALNAGFTFNEIKQIILQSLLYASVTRVEKALLMLKELELQNSTSTPQEKK